MALDEQELLEHYVEKAREAAGNIIFNFGKWLRLIWCNCRHCTGTPQVHRYVYPGYVYRHDIGANHMVVLSQTEFSRRVLEIGQVDRARQAIEAAKSVLELTGEQCYEPEVFRVDAEVNHAEGGVHVHERLEALASARQRDAKLWELKTATSWLAGINAMMTPRRREQHSHRSSRRLAIKTSKPLARAQASSTRFNVNVNENA